jgi:hypothetical protein
MLDQVEGELGSKACDMPAFYGTRWPCLGRAPVLLLAANASLQLPCDLQQPACEEQVGGEAEGAQQGGLSALPRTVPRARRTSLLAPCASPEQPALPRPRRW